MSQLKGRFFVLVTRSRGKTLNDNKTFLIGTVHLLSEDIYEKYVDNYTKFSHNYFTYFKLVKCYSKYHYPFLVVKKAAVMSVIIIRSGEVRFLVTDFFQQFIFLSSHFYMTYRKKIKVKKISFAAFRKEALLYHDSSLKEQIQKYVSFDSCSQTFFF